jgi:hypothetical protein
MPDNASVTPANDSAVIDRITRCVYEAILEIQQHQPELLTDKYRTVSWKDDRNRSAFLSKLKQGLSQTRDEGLILKLKKFLQFLLIAQYFDSPRFSHLIEQIRSLSAQPAETNNSNGRGTLQPTGVSVSQMVAAPAEPSQGIAILLLDAENLQLDTNTEKFLAEVCTYPIQIKIAFANWRHMGKQDIEFHGRGYELIHVPAGKDSADVKMATVGSSIFIHYPTAKEVLVCSSDGVLSHLVTTLRTHGLTVYLVRKQGDQITVLNSKTSQTQIHPLKPLPQIPSAEEFINQIKELVQIEQVRTESHWVRLSRISSLFQSQYKLSIPQVVGSHFPGKKFRDVFLENPNKFVIHQLLDNPELYVSLFELESRKTISNKNTSQNPDVTTATETPETSTQAKISSQADLEQFLVKIIQSSTSQAPGSYIPINFLGTQFQRQYGQSVSTVIRQLQLKGNFLNFLQSSSVFQLKQTNQIWKVAVHVNG